MIDSGARDSSPGTAPCFSCGRPPTHRSQNGRVLLCDYHVRALPGTDQYLPIDLSGPPDHLTPPAQTAATDDQPRDES